jgi:hypothetical protein
MSVFTGANFDEYNFNSDNFSNMGFTCACRSAFVLSDDDTVDDADDDAGSMIRIKKQSVMSKYYIHVVYNI